MPVNGVGATTEVNIKFADVIAAVVALLIVNEVVDALLLRKYLQELMSLLLYLQLPQN
jgi:hypothetical protein